MRGRNDEVAIPQRAVEIGGHQPDHLRSLSQVPRLFTYNRAGAVVIKEDHVLLVSLQPPGQRRWWHFPGGGIDEGESPEEAAVRELFEETGLRSAETKEYIRAGVHGGQHHYFLITCDDLTLGEVTGPELEYAADADFRAEWVPISALAAMPVFPRCVAEHVAAVGSHPSSVACFEDDRNSWDGIPGENPPPHLHITARAVVTDGSRIAAIERALDGEQWFTLPGGGILDGETAEETAVRESDEELGLDVTAASKLAVVVYRCDGETSLQTYVWCEVAGEFGTGHGDEYAAERQAKRGTYRPVWLDVSALPDSLRPTWLIHRLPRWLDDPRPARPERFCEIHD